MTDAGDRHEAISLVDLSLALLSLASGTTDATAFLKLGTVFTSAMTGNTVLLGIALGQGRIVEASRAFDAFASFLVGVTLAAILCRRRPGNSSGAPILLPAFAIEIACLVGFALLWGLSGRVEGYATIYGLITLSALAMGIQGVAARQIAAPGINTIVFTSTMISIVTSLTNTLARRTGGGAFPFATKRQIVILLVYAFGAVLAGALISADIGLFVWLPLIAVVGAGASYEFGRKLERSAR
jgi:uncharacterized membrane protein YoaK (UPF0700 family)